MEHRHTRLKAFANLMEREYWIHAVLPKRCASVAELPGGSKEEPVRLLHTSTNQGCGHMFGGCAEPHFEQGRNEKNPLPWAVFCSQPACYGADSSVASKSRRRGSCKARALCCAAASKHSWEQTVNAERGRYRSSSRLRTPHPSHLNVIVHSPICTPPPAASLVSHH